MSLRTGISAQNSSHKENFTYCPMLIIGAGVAGIAMACRLKERLGFEQFRVYERQSGIGGRSYFE